MNKSFWVFKCICYSGCLIHRYCLYRIVAFFRGTTHYCCTVRVFKSGKNVNELLIKEQWDSLVRVVTVFSL